MRKLIIILRILLGVILLIGSVPFFLKLTPEAELVGSMKLFNDGINAAIYLMPFYKGSGTDMWYSFFTK